MTKFFLILIPQLCMLTASRNVFSPEFLEIRYEDLILSWNERPWELQNIALWDTHLNTLFCKFSVIAAAVEITDRRKCIILIVWNFYSDYYIITFRARVVRGNHRNSHKSDVQVISSIESCQQ